MLLTYTVPNPVRLPHTEVRTVLFDSSEPSGMWTYTDVEKRTKPTMNDSILKGKRMHHIGTKLILPPTHR